jgi:hypothetical protein
VPEPEPVWAQKRRRALALARELAWARGPAPSLVAAARPDLLEEGSAKELVALGHSMLWAVYACLS